MASQTKVRLYFTPSLLGPRNMLRWPQCAAEVRERLAKAEQAIASQFNTQRLCSDSDSTTLLVESPLDQMTVVDRLEAILLDFDVAGYVPGYSKSNPRIFDIDRYFSHSWPSLAAEG
jgi:hypothetical protein